MRLIDFNMSTNSVILENVCSLEDELVDFFETLINFEAIELLKCRSRYTVELLETITSYNKHLKTFKLDHPKGALTFDCTKDMVEGIRMLKL